MKGISRTRVDPSLGERERFEQKGEWMNGPSAPGGRAAESKMIEKAFQLVERTKRQLVSHEVDSFTAKWCKHIYLVASTSPARLATRSPMLDLSDDRGG
jgi:hypothetical protein